MADTSTTPSENDLRTHVARHVEVRREEIVKKWIDGVVSDPEIPATDRLTHSAIEDHFPEMLQELAAIIRSGGAEVAEGAIKETGAAHGKMRWKNGYRLDEVLRELGRIREIILGEIRAVLAGNAAEDAEPITRDVQRFFCMVSATSAIQFSAAQSAELLLRNRQLQHAYEQLQAATAEARDIAESRLTLLRGVAHELRNSLQPVSLAATILKDSADWDPEADASLRFSATRLQSLLSTLSDFTSLLAGELEIEIEKFSLRDLLDYLDSKHRVTAERKGLRFEVRLHGESAEVNSDLAKVKLIADELVKNAIKFTESGFVRVEIVGPNEGRWILRVADSGPGIDSNTARQVFRELHGSSEGPNVGARLGLLIARHLARLLDGELTFTTGPHEGSIFQANLSSELRSPGPRAGGSAP